MYLNPNDNFFTPLEKTKGLNDSDNIHSRLSLVQNPISFPTHVTLRHNNYNTLSDVTCYEIIKSPIFAKCEERVALKSTGYRFYPPSWKWKLMDEYISYVRPKLDPTTEKFVPRGAGDNFDNDNFVLGNTILNTTPMLHDLSTPTLSERSDISNSSMEISINNVEKGNIFGDWGKNDFNQAVCIDNCDESLSNEEEKLSEEFFDHRDINYQEVSQVLREIRIQYVNRVIIGHLNVNFFASKLDAIKTIIPGNVDIMIFSETKLDASYRMAQLLIDGFGKPFRLDRNAHGGGLLICMRSDIP